MLIRVFRGDTPTLNFTLTQGGSAFDLTGATVRFMAKKNLSDADANAIIDSPCTLGVAADGECNVKLTTTDTAIAFRDLIAEVEVTTSGGDTLTAEQFTLEIADDVRKGT